MARRWLITGVPAFGRVSEGPRSFSTWLVKIAMKRRRGRKLRRAQEGRGGGSLKENEKEDERKGLHAAFLEDLAGKFRWRRLERKECEKLCRRAVTELGRTNPASVFVARLCQEMSIQSDGEALNLAPGLVKDTMCRRAKIMLGREACTHSFCTRTTPAWPRGWFRGGAMKAGCKNHGCGLHFGLH